VTAITGSEGNQANTSLDKEEMRRREFFTADEDDQYSELPSAGCRNMRITGQAVEQAMVAQSVKKPPGLDKLLFVPIRLLWKWDKVRIMGLMNAAIRIGRHPAVWKRARGVVIRKPGKDNYRHLKASRSISLLNCIGKVVEIVVAELLSEKDER
jgi:hypothetical protein